MKTLTFLAITLLSGAIAGAVLELINLVIVEPFIDKAISIETHIGILCHGDRLHEKGCVKK
jgi:hypothetical protein